MNRTPDGRWWAECEAILPARYEHTDGRTKSMGAPSPISVPADDITPIPGEDYSAVPTDGAIVGRQWVVEKRREYTEDGPSRRLHRRDCWQARDSHERITTEDAVECGRDVDAGCVWVEIGELPDPARLTPDQRAGYECALCGMRLYTSRCLGAVNGVQLWACSPVC
ncbi:MULTISPECIES: DUF6233 domain-containing protein [unclassified Streptomyces]|uniref:DUF6233 domain-containing protein n=1 Tax=unclassified Streptomyces TaxID=2593676 RepID=UPI003369F24C